VAKKLPYSNLNFHGHRNHTGAKSRGFYGTRIRSRSLFALWAILVERAITVARTTRRIIASTSTMRHTVNQFNLTPADDISMVSIMHDRMAIVNRTLHRERSHPRVF
jgi:hypothetical protein